MNNRRNAATMANGPKGRRFTSSRLIWAALGCAVLWHIGINVDAWYHLHYGFEIETFFTWPHALVYGGWLALGAVTTLYVVESMIRGEARGAWVPPGFRLVLLGSAIFGIGGAIDLVWHSIAGFEVSFDALVTPPHLVLLAAFVLSSVGLLNAAVAFRSRDGALSWRPHRRDVPVIGVLAILFGVSLYALGWIDPFAVDYASGGALASRLFGFAGLATRGQTAQVAGVIGIVLHGILQTVFLLCPLKWLRLPGGFITTTMLWVGLLVAAVTDGWIFVPAILAGAFVGEAIWWWIWRGGLGGTGDSRGYWLLAFLIPVAEFSIYDAMVALLGGGLAWTTHLWAGAPFMAGLYATLVALFIVPPRFLTTGPNPSWPES